MICIRQIVKQGEIDRGIRLGPDRYDSVVFRDDGSVFAQLCRRTIIQGRTLGIEYDIHNSNLTGVCDEEIPLFA